MPAPRGPQDRLSTDEAARVLQVKRSTLYAYVSRGYIQSHRSGLNGRGASVFSRSEIEDLAQRRRKTTPRPEPPSTTLPLPPRDVPVSTIREDDVLLFRDQDVTSLARSSTFEATAEWLWTGESRFGSTWAANPAGVRLGQAVNALLPGPTLPMDRFTALLPALALADPLRLDLTPQAVLLTVRSLMATLVESLPALAPDGFVGSALAERLWVRLTNAAPDPAHVRLLDAALIVLIDNGSAPPATATAVLAAQLRSDPYAVVSAAMGVGAGAQHSLPFLRLQSLFAEVHSAADALIAIGNRLRQGEDVPGFGPRQYQHADPRARVLLELLHETLGDRDDRFAGVRQVIQVMRDRRGLEPNVEVAVAALAAIAGMCPGAGEAIFRVARTAGYLAHAIDAYAQSPRSDLPSFATR
jgi:citrate synthase